MALAAIAATAICNPARAEWKVPPLTSEARHAAKTNAEYAATLPSASPLTDGGNEPKIDAAFGEFAGEQGVPFIHNDSRGMSEAIDQLIARVRAVGPGSSQVEIVTGLTQAYCRWAVKSGMIGRLDSPRVIGRFSRLVFTELISHGKD